MIRRVAMGKAVAASAAGAVAWEAALRPLLWAGAPLMDLVRTLGTMLLGEAPAWQWWPLGLALHAVVGSTWAVFYAYFFWSELPWRPALQGLAFAILPRLLAGLVMVPQMGWMHPLVLCGGPLAVGRRAQALLAAHLLWGTAVGLVLPSISRRVRADLLAAPPSSPQNVH